MQYLHVRDIECLNLVWSDLEADESEQRIIALARELHQAKLSSRKIAAKLAEQGFYSRVGTVFTSTAVLAMVAD
jgi:hypothetical protein